MDWIAWIPVVLTVIGAAYTWYKSTRMLPHEIEKTKAETSKLITSAAGEVVDQLQRRVERLEIDIVQLKLSNAALSAEIVSLKTSAIKSDSDNMKLKKRIGVLERENAKLKERVIELEDENKAMRAKIGENH